MGFIPQQFTISLDRYCNYWQTGSQRYKIQQLQSSDRFEAWMSNGMIAMNKVHSWRSHIFKKRKDRSFLMANSDTLDARYLDEECSAEMLDKFQRCLPRKAPTKSHSYFAGIVWYWAKHLVWMFPLCIHAFLEVFESNPRWIPWNRFPLEWLMNYVYVFFTKYVYQCIQVI